MQSGKSISDQDSGSLRWDENHPSALPAAEPLNEDTAKALLEGKEAINVKHVEDSQRHLTDDITKQLLSSTNLHLNKEEIAQLLKVALEIQNKEICQTLIDKGADVDFRIAEKATKRCLYQSIYTGEWGQLLHRAINGSNCGVVGILLEHGVEVTFEHIEHTMYLPSYTEDMTKLLLQPDHAKLHEYEDEDLQELLHIAIRKQNEHGCRVLIEHGVKVKFEHLQLICFLPRRITRHFLNVGHLVDLSHQQEGVILRTAINCRFTVLCNMMIERGVDVNQVGQLHSAVPVDIDPVSQEEHSPLYLAVRLNSLSMSRMLVEAGAALSVVDIHGPVLCKAQGNHLKQYLISSGSDLILCARHYVDTTRQGISSEHTQTMSQEQRDYLRAIAEGVPKLLHLCRVAIRKQIRDCHFRELVFSLPLPEVMKNYLLYSDYPVEDVEQEEDESEPSSDEDGSDAIELCLPWESESSDEDGGEWQDEGEGESEDEGKGENEG